jgi:hypothetical protein
MSSQGRLLFNPAREEWWDAVEVIPTGTDLGICLGSWTTAGTKVLGVVK